MGKNGSKVADCDSTFEVIGIGPATASLSEKATAGLSERCLSPQEFQTKRTQVVQSGTWWNVWTHASGCDYCDPNPNKCSQAIVWSSTTTATFSANFDLSTQGDVLDAIKGNSGLNLGYTWAEANTKGASETCDTEPGSVGRIMAQNEMGWADSQVMYGYTYAGCGTVYTDWEDWSENMRSDWPLDEIDSVNHRCSYGVDDTGCPPRT